MRIASHLILITLPALVTRMKRSLALLDMHSAFVTPTQVQYIAEGLQRANLHRIEDMRSKGSCRKPSPGPVGLLKKDGLAPPSLTVSAPSFFQAIPYQ
jgi:hypothetical protein